MALLGIIFTVGGAAVETCLAGAYNICQYFGLNWGRAKSPQETPHFTVAWVVIFALAFLVMILGIDPVNLVEYAVIFSVLALPFTYYPVLKTAGDKKLMGKYASGTVAKTIGWIYFGLIAIIALAAIPLMIMTNMGNG